MVVRIIKKGNSIVEKKVEPKVHKSFNVVKREPTLRQKGVIATVGKGRKSKAQILRENGYAPSTVDHPKRVFDKPLVQEGVKVVIAKMEAERDAILERMKITRDKANYGTLSMTLSIVNKDIELLSGKPTDRTEYILPDDEKVRLDKLLEMNRKK